MWKTAKLGDVADIKIGKTPPRKNAKYWDKEKVSGNVWLSIADLTASKGRYVSDSKEYVSDEGAALFKVVPKATLIMSFKLSIGKLAFTDKDLRTNEAIAALRIKDENILTKEYLYHALSLINWERLAGDDVKVKGKTLNKAKLKKIRFLLPALAEQQRIVAKLDAVFAEIDVAVAATKRKQEQVGSLKNALLSSELSATANDAAKWKTVKLGDVAGIKIGKTPARKNAEYWDKEKVSGNVWVSIADLTASKGRYVSDSKEYVSDEGAALFKVVPKATLIMSFKLSIGKLAFTDKDLRTNEAIAALKIKDENILTKEYLYHALSLINWERLAGDDVKVKGKTLNKAKLNKIKFPLPSLAEQQRIVAKLDAVFEQADVVKDVMSKQLANYQALKSALLSAELTGEAA